MKHSIDTKADSDALVVVLKGAGFKTLRGKELSVSAVLGILLGLLYLVLPLNDLDAVGFFGAYMIINAVHLGIAAASERPSRVEV